MPMKFGIKRVFSARTTRVKCIDIHPREPWVLLSYFTGSVQIWNYTTKTLIKTFEVIDLPIRAAKFISRKNWFITASDDMFLRVFNYNTQERINAFDAHTDFIRSLAVHPTQPFVISSSDDMVIKLWNWEKKWQCEQVFEGHYHYVMQIVINPKDNNTFASASLDTTIKVWQLGSNTPNFTLTGHDSGVNCVDYYSGGDKPYLVSGADDRLVKIWDYQNKTCVQTLKGHTENITTVCFHPTLPIILSGGEDDTVRIWHANTYRSEKTLNYGLERAWVIAALPGSNMVALGFDNGAIILKVGSEEPAMSMDSNGKFIFAKHTEIQQANLKNLQGLEINDGERLSLPVKDIGSCEIYPQSIAHNPNGRFVVVCGDGEYIIYTAMALRNKAFGSAQEFVWALDSSMYAVRLKDHIKIFKNFKEFKDLKQSITPEGIYGGFLLGVKTSDGLAFYDWDSVDTLIRRIEITPQSIFWSDNGELVCITTDESFFILKYNAEAASKAQETNEGITEDGVEDAFEVVGEVEEVVKTGTWVGDCFIYTNSVNRINYYVGGEIVTISHMDRVMYILGYIPRDNRLYLGDKELNVVSYSLLLSVLEYQTAVMRRDFETADKVLPTVPREQRTRVAHFLEKQDFKSQALAVTMDMDHKFELAMQLKDIKIAYQVAKTIESEEKWKQLSELATSKCEFKLAAECLHNAQDYGGLLLLATCTGDETMVENIAQSSDESNKSNISFVSNLLLGRVEECIDILVKTGRVPEAAFFARTYMPSKMAQIVSLWKENLGKFDKKKSEALADPEKYENLFVGLKEAYYGEKFVKKTEKKYLASEYPNVMVPCERNIMSELQQALEDGLVSIDEETKDVKVTMVTKEPSPVSENMQNDEESRETKPRSDTDVSLDLDMDNVNYDDITDIDFNIDDDILTD